MHNVLLSSIGHERIDHGIGSLLSERDATPHIGKHTNTATSLSPQEIDVYAQWSWLSGRYVEAIGLYTDLLSVNRKFPHIHFKLAYLYLCVCEYHAAIRHFDHEIERYSDATDANNKYQEHGNQQQERAYLFCAYSGRSSAYHMLGDQMKSDIDKRFMTSCGVYTKVDLLSMGSLYFRLGMLQRADECYERCAATCDSSDPDYLVEHADLRLAQHRCTNAIIMYEQCRMVSSPSSLIYHRSLIGQATALMRQEKLQEAAILLLTSINTLRKTIRTAQSTDTTHNDSEPRLIDLIYLYHHATNIYGGLCIMKGELKAALDTYYSIKQPPSFNDIVPFHLPLICVTPGTKHKPNGEVVEFSKFSIKHLREMIRHLNELEWRYGPDACLYFHRANIYRALGVFDEFVHDLSLVESMDPDFLVGYHQRGAMLDFLDIETVSWIPIKFMEAIYDALEQKEYCIPHGEMKGMGPLEGKIKGKRSSLVGSSNSKELMFSEMAMIVYFQERIRSWKEGKQSTKGICDEYAIVYQLDLYRRIPVGKRHSPRNKMESMMESPLSPSDGVLFDDRTIAKSATAQDPNCSPHLLHDLIQDTIAKLSKNPSVYMIAGMVELELCNAAKAQHHFTKAIHLIDHQVSSSRVKETLMSSLAQRWYDNTMQRVKYYCLIWRSITSRIKIEMEKAVEDLNLAAAIRLSDDVCGSDDPLLLVQRVLILLLNGSLKSAYKLLRQLKKRFVVTHRIRRMSSRALALEMARTNRTSSNLGSSDGLELIDMLSNVGLNTFHLLPLKLEKEFLRHTNTHGLLTDIMNEEDGDEIDQLTAQEKEVEKREEQEEEQVTSTVIRNTFTKKAQGQNETMDRIFDSSLLKLSTNGNISSVLPYFQAILSTDDSYLPPTNFASLELLKCKEQESMDEKLYHCFVRLCKRSKWLQRKIKWKYEALIDYNLAHAYLPTDIDTLWNRARLLQEQLNYSEAILDLNTCLTLLNPTLTTSNELPSFLNETKKAQWLQLQLERGTLHMHLYQWEEAIQNLSLVILHAGPKHQTLESTASEARSCCFIRLQQYTRAIQDLQHWLTLTQETTKTIKKKDLIQPSELDENRIKQDRVLVNLLIGNLYCQLAVDQIKINASVMQQGPPSATMTPRALRQFRSIHANMGMLSSAAKYYDNAHILAPDHFLMPYFRGRMYALAGQTKHAIHTLVQCLKIHPTFLPALFLRGSLYAQDNLMVLALADFYRIRHRTTTYPNLHICIGYCHYQQGEMEKAIESFTQAIIQVPDHVEALYMRGCALQELLILDKAIEDFANVIEIQPSYYQAYYQRAVCLVLNRSYSEALVDMNIVVALQPEWRDGWTLHAYTCFCAERYDLAVSSYSRALNPSDSNPNSHPMGGKASPRDSVLYMYRAMTHLRLNQLSHALTDLEYALKRDNENYIAFLAKAFCLTKMGEKEKAAQVLIHCLGHYKQMKLVQVPDTEESKSARKQMDNSGVATKDIWNTDMKKKTKESDMTRADHNTVFRLRKELRNQEIQPSTSKTLAKDTEHKSQFNLSKEKMTNRPQEKAKLRTKLVKVMKKLASEYRVVKALEQATLDKSKKNQHLTMILSDLMRNVSKIPWPQGTLSTKLLAWAFNTVGIHHLQNKHMDEALMTFTLAIQADPTHATSYCNRGNVYLQMDVLATAISAFLDSIERDNTYYRAFNNTGVAYFRLKMYEEAQDAFSTGLHYATQGKERAILLYNLGVVFQALERADEALDFYQQAIALDATRTEFFNNRSAILHHQMRFSVALGDCNYALKLQRTTGSSEGEENLVTTTTSDGVEAQLNRAQLYIAMGNCTLAIKDLNEALILLNQRHRIQRRQSRITNTALSTAAAAVTAQASQADEDMVIDLLWFCHQWRSAMRIAIKDFLFAFHAFPCFAKFEFFTLYGPELTRRQDKEKELSTEKLLKKDGDEQLNGDTEVDVIPLPIVDESFFAYERDFAHWRVLDDERNPVAEENAEDDEEPNERVRECKRGLWQNSFAVDCQHALRSAKMGDYEAASRTLLRAHYKTTLDSHDEYFLLTWRVQVTAQMEQYQENQSIDSDEWEKASIHPPSESGLSSAIVLLRDFLNERKTKYELNIDVYSDGDDNQDHQQLSHNETRSNSKDIDEDEDEEESLDAEKEWNQQRRVIRADLYNYLGILCQMNGQLYEARKAFMLALRLRNDHVIALLNYLQLSITCGEYETAMDALLKVFEMFLNRGKTNVTPSMSNTSNICGLLNADRSTSSLFPVVRDAFNDSELVTLGSQMLSLLKEYRGMLTAQIETNRLLIFKMQGSIAHLVQEVWYLVSSREGTALNLQLNDVKQPTISQHIDKFNGTLDEYHAKILNNPLKYANEEEFDAFYNTFLEQFAQVCNEVAKTLPSEETEKKQQESKTTEGPSPTKDADETIEQFLAQSSRPSAVPKASPNKFRHTSSLRAIVRMSTFKASSPSKTNPTSLQPQRPKLEHDRAFNGTRRRLI